MIGRLLAHGVSRPGLAALGLASVIGGWYLVNVARNRPPIEPPPAPVPAVQRLAARWVGALNDLAPHAFLAFTTDSAADLYLVPGAWFASLTPQQRCAWQAQYEARWQSYLRSSVGDWDSTSAFAPRLVPIDSSGQVGCPTALRPLASRP